MRRGPSTFEYRQVTLTQCALVRTLFLSPLSFSRSRLFATDLTSPGSAAGRNVAARGGGEEIPAPPAPHTRDPEDPCKLGDVMIPRPFDWSPGLGGARGERGALAHENQ